MYPSTDMPNAAVDLTCMTKQASERVTHLSFIVWELAYLCEESNPVKYSATHSMLVARIRVVLQSSDSKESVWERVLRIFNSQIVFWKPLSCRTALPQLYMDMNCIMVYWIPNDSSSAAGESLSFGS